MMTSCTWASKTVLYSAHLVIAACAIASVTTGFAEDGADHPSVELEEIIRPADIADATGLSGWFDEIFKPEMRVKASAFIYVDWRVFEQTADSRRTAGQPLRIRIDLGIAEPVDMTVEEISRTASDTVKFLSGPVWRDDANVGSAVLRPSLNRKEFRGYVRLTQGKFVIAPTPRLPTHVVYLNDWEAIRGADSAHQQQGR
jgi:hypothetical protein